MCSRPRRNIRSFASGLTVFPSGRAPFFIPHRGFPHALPPLTSSAAAFRLPIARLSLRRFSAFPAPGAVIRCVCFLCSFRSAPHFLVHFKHTPYWIYSSQPHPRPSTVYKFVRVCVLILRPVRGGQQKESTRVEELLLSSKNGF